MFRLQLAAFASLLLVLGAPLTSAQTCTTSWTAAAGGSWSTPGNWSAGTPTASSTACITLSGTYTVTSPTSALAVNELVIGGSSGTQTLAISRDFSVTTTGQIRANGALDWSDGYLRGSLTNKGMIRLVGTPSSRGVREAGTLLRNEGTVTWESAGPFYIFNDARVENAGLWEVTSGGDLFGSHRVGTFVNESSGTFRKSGGGADDTQLTAGGLVIENEGTFEALAGTILFERPSTHTDASFVVASGAALVFESRGVHFEGTTTGSPAGSLRIQDAFTAGSGAVWDLGGTGMEWVSNYLVPGSTTAGDLTNTGLIRLVGTGDSRGVRGADALLRNEGTVTWESTGLFYISQNARVENAGLWDITSDGDLFGSSGTGTFANESSGTFRKSGGTDATLLRFGGLVVENEGVFEALSGALHLACPSTHTDASFVAGEGATLVFGGGTVTFEGTTTGAPEGALRIEAPFVAGSGAVWDVEGTGIEWASNYLEDGTLTNTGVVRLASATSSRGVRGGATFRNQSAVEWESSGAFYVYQDARVENASSWTVLDGGDLFGSTGVGTFVNESSGTFRTSGGGTDATRLGLGELMVENEGVFDVLDGGMLRIERFFEHVEGGVLQGDGTIRVTVNRLDHGGDTVPNGDLIWDGTFAPEATSSLHIDIGGTTPGTEHDQLVVDGAAHLNGQLVVDVAGGYTPSNGDAFTVLTATNLMGGFELVGLTDNGISLYPTFSETDLTLTASEGVPTISGGISVTPDQIVNDETAEMTITGTGFAPDVSVRFLCNDCIEPDLFGEITGLVRSISPTEIVVTFSVVDLGIAGLYDVVVTDPRGGSATTPIAITPEDLTVIVEAADPDAAERGADRGTFLVRVNARLAAPLDVRFSLTGTATRYTDYALSSSRNVARIPRGETTAVVAVVPLADAATEGAETVELTLETDDVDYEIGASGSATITIADGPPPTTFDILASQPREGGAGVVSLTLSGQNIGTDATAQLSCSGTTYNAVETSTATSGTSLFAQFDLSDQAPASCSVTVVSGGDFKTLTGAFQIEETVAPDLSLELISPERRRRGRTVRHRIIVTNRGNVDAFMVPVEIVVNAGAVIETEFNVVLPEEEPDFDDFGSWDDIDIQRTLEDRTILPIVLPVVPAGGEIELSFHSDASRITASVLTPLLSSASPESGEGILAPEYAEQFARVTGAQSSGELASCWGKKLFFAAVDLAATQASAVAQCVISLGSHLVQSFLFLLDSEENHRLRRNPDTLALSGVMASVMGALTTCASSGGRTFLPWVQVGAFVWGFITAVNDAANNCPRKPKESETEEVASSDPNDKLGPVGVDIERYFRGEAERLFYTIRYENKESATAPAAEVFVTDTLDVAVFDPATFSLGPITFGDSTLATPPGLQAWSTTLDLRPERPMLLQISGSIDAEGLIQWAFTTLDPNTLDIPEDPLVGFLPPNATAPEGEGAVSFYVGLQDDLPDGTIIENDARIVFDLNEPIDTPAWTNTIDRSMPSSRVEAITPSATSDTTLVLSITSSDDGSGVLDYDIYASPDGGPFELAFTARDGDTAFQANPGIVYSFFSIARDRVGNMEPPKTEAEATTVWPVDAAESPDASLPDEVTLAEPYPNPTRGAAVVQFGLPTASRVGLRVYDVQGREVARITDEEHPAGWHRLPWSADGLAPGVYILRLQVGDEMLTQRLTVVR